MFDIMQQVQEYFTLAMQHVMAYQLYYGVGVLVGAPFLYFTRRWTIPFILFCLEITIYVCLMHAFINTLLHVTAWFKEASSMQMLREDGRPTDKVDWTTPLINFWDKTGYNPTWIIYLECVLVCVIIVLVFRFRPLKTQKPKPRFNADGSPVNKDDKDGSVAKYGRRRYADEWAKEAARSSRDTRMRKQSEKKD